MNDKTNKLLDITTQLEVFKSYMNALDFSINPSLKGDINDLTLLIKQVNNAEDFKTCFLNSISKIILELEEIQGSYEQSETT